MTLTRVGPLTISEQQDRGSRLPGLTPGRQTFLGRTATRILGHLPVPMIIIPRKEVENRQRNS